MTEIPYHRRKYPEILTELEATAAQEIAAHESKTAHRPLGFDTLTQASQLSDPILEEARYYSLGRGMCELAISLNTPSVKERVVQRCGELLVSRRELWNKASVGQPPVTEIQSRHLPALSPINGHLDVIREVTEASVKNLPLEARIASDALIRVEMHRRSSRQPFSVAGLREDPARSMAEGDYTTDAIARAFFQAAVSVTQAIVEKSTEGRTANKDDHTNPHSHPGLSPVVAQTLQELPLQRAALQAARLRLDIFRTHLPDLIGCVLNDDNSFLRTKAPLLMAQLDADCPPHEQNPRLLHTDVLACPAASVQGLIPMVLDIMRTSIDLANQQPADNA